MLFVEALETVVTLKQTIPEQISFKLILSRSPKGFVQGDNWVVKLKMNSSSTMPFFKKIEGNMQISSTLEHKTHTEQQFHSRTQSTFFEGAPVDGTSITEEELV